MGQDIRMPSERELPDGARRAFVEELFEHYRAANRPTLREIHDVVVKARDELDLKGGGTASTETIRRTLKGLTVPRWPAVYAIAVALAKLSGRSLEDPKSDHFGKKTSYVAALNQRWNDARDEDPTPPVPEPVIDPWSMPAGGYSDEPPF